MNQSEYRYKYQGQEKDAEKGMGAFELRLWDARIGRWLTTDPAGQYSSPYLGMGNNPVIRVDPDGGSDCPYPPCNGGAFYGGSLGEVSIIVTKSKPADMPRWIWDTDFGFYSTDFKGSLSDYNKEYGTNYIQGKQYNEYYYDNFYKPEYDELISGMHAATSEAAGYLLGFGGYFVPVGWVFKGGRWVYGGLKYIRYGGKTFTQYKAIYWATRTKPTLSAIEGPAGQVWKQYTELHHRFIPQRWNWAPNWLKNNSYNLQPLSSYEYALRDPYRARFAPQWAKELFNLKWK